ncbi:hypothetical protein U8527_20845 [Kordia algicida OT-1]|uniref:PepSY domain-containing protein n=1 Tax=Kordia algicida OT-1 TaxID=391587 RepID=A9DL14_9FLAO|nr:hypothetical protein [Kordia algicida]EDP98453.1 hypothetical protein KAOT1_14587 [Kordia algicida OT-1]
MKYYFIVLCLGFSLYCSAQNSYKYEKEDRIEKQLFPQNALKLLEETLPKKVKKLKYYKEQDSVKISYETKLKYKGTKYSIEFDKKGHLEDVEVTIKQKHIPPKTLEMIKKHMYDEYDSFRIKKIQRQYRNSKNSIGKKVIKNAFSEAEDSSFYYEIIAEVKTGKKRYFIEITFTKTGKFDLVRTIIRSSYDHILY